MPESRSNIVREALYVLGDVVHHLQRERGCATVFLYSDRTLFAQHLQTQFIASDKAIHTLHKKLERWVKSQTLKPYQVEKLNRLLLLCLGLPKWRGDLSAAEAMPAADCICHYSHHLISPLLHTMVDILLTMEASSMSAENLSYISVYNAFLQWKERIGLERAIGARGFVRQHFQNKEFIEHISFILSEQNSYKNTYFALANPEQRALITEALAHQDNQLDYIYSLLESSPDDSLLDALTPESWFELISVKIDALYVAEKRLIDSFTSKQDTPDKNNASLSSLNSDFNSYGELIASLQLFFEMPQEDIDLLLKHSKIHHLNKGKYLFLEGEPANQLHIILKGWSKIFKSSTDGEEIILQMLSSGDAIMESAVFLHSTLPVSAQIVSDATLLSIPAVILREQLKNNNKLMHNFLDMMSYRSQSLMNQIMDTRLKTVDERIGWFLLQQFLDQEVPSYAVELPYEKSLIASYLDMRRETFSRVLSRMKERGFKIENDKIIIPDFNALCNFCNYETAQQDAGHGEGKLS